MKKIVQLAFLISFVGVTTNYCQLKETLYDELYGSYDYDNEQLEEDFNDIVVKPLSEKIREIAKNEEQKIIDDYAEKGIDINTLNAKNKFDPENFAVISKVWERARLHEISEHPDALLLYATNSPYRPLVNELMRDNIPNAEKRAILGKFKESYPNADSTSEIIDRMYKQYYEENYEE
jgi:hypothetical protein